jgi:hypothetical protein
MAKTGKRLAGIVFFWAFAMVSTFAFAGEIDTLVQKLVEKGVIANGEAQQIITETQEEMRVQLAEGKVPTLPSWLQKLKISGDLRLRYQYDDTKHDSNDKGRSRGRIRYRLGMDAQINDKVLMAAGIASGGSDPRSRNVTFDGTFEGKAICLDYAYMEYDPFSWLTLVGGKMKRKGILWEPTDLLWDTDITPEGGSVLLSKDLGNVGLFSNFNVYVLEESSSDNSDPIIAAFQPGLSWKINDSLNLKMAATYYGIDTKGKALTHPGTGNTMVGNNQKYDYDSISPAFELGINNPLGDLVPYASLFGEYIHAFDPKENENGFSAGLKFGSQKIKAAGDWQFKYIYKRLEADCWLDALPDSDAYGGDTNAKGHEWIMEYGLGKNVTFGIDCYYMQPIKAINGMNPEKKQFVAQVDVVVKF